MFRSSPILVFKSKAMATFKTFEEIEVWKKARVLSKTIFELTTKGSFARDFALRDQINRSSGSIMDNIAEGFERGGNKEFVQFLSYSKGSSGETRSQLYRALDRTHITQLTFSNLTSQAIDISKMLSGLTVYLNSTDYKGVKFRNRW
jgi:four helix bundle protein